MRILLIFLFHFFPIVIFSQDIQGITVVVHDSYSFYGSEKYPGDSIVFKLDNDGSLSASNYYRSNKKKKLKSIIKINKKELQTFNNWNLNNRSEFGIKELEIDTNSFNKMIGKAINNKLINFEVHEFTTINLDSFEFCQNYRLRDRRSLHDGKPTLVKLEYDNGTFETLILRDQVEHLLDLRKYIYCYYLLKNKLPESLRSSSEFNQQSLEYRLINYLIITECEGYYRAEYYSKIPDISAQDKRMGVGWNYKKYLSEREEN